MKSIILTLSTLAIAATSINAKTADSIPAQELREIVVEAPKVIRKADMDVYYPPKSTVAMSKDGVQLIKNLMIPSLNVNDVLGSITASGENVQMRINGRQATLEQVKALLPESIKRVEWIDNPGLRYNGASGVLNFIVVNPDAGGSLITQAMQALNCAWGPYNAALKLNNGRSQWGLSTNYKMTNHIGSHREYYEQFLLPNGTTVDRTENPTGGYMSDTFGSLQLDYSYIKPDTTVFWIAIHGYRQWNEATKYVGIMSLSSSSDRIRLDDYSDKRGFTPSVAAYFEQHFNGNQLIAVDANASLYNGHTGRTYTERSIDTERMLTDVNTLIRDRNQAFGIEADYIKNWRKSRFTAGASYTANRNRSVYENLGGEVFHQRQDKIYFFGEYYQRINKVTLTAGLGAQYTSFRFKESGLGSDTWNLRPQFTATYAPSQTSQFRLNFTSWQSAPSLAETNVAPQQTDGFQWRIGNPNLKTSSSYMLTLRYNFTFPRIMGSFGIRAFTSPDAITPLTLWQNDRLVTTYENSRGLQNLTLFLSPQIVVIPDWLTLTGTLQYRAERMRGTGYRHYNHNWSGDITAMAQHWGFTLTAQYQKAQSDLWGETISWGESISVIALSYDWNNFEFTAGALCPFSKYDRGSRSLNRYNTNETHVRLDMAPMPFLQIRYNLQWGRQKRGAQKLINADATVDQSSAGSK